MAKQTEYWLCKLKTEYAPDTGQIWAVKLEDSKIIGACGPITDNIYMEDTPRTRRFLESAHYLNSSRWCEKPQPEHEEERDFKVLVRHVVTSTTTG